MSYLTTTRDLRMVRRATDIFNDCRRTSTSRGTNRRMLDLISDRDFLHAVFCPDTRQPDEFNSCLTDMYNAASKKSTIRVLANTLADYGFSHMQRRTTAVFITTIINMGMAGVNGDAQELGRLQDHGEISERNFDAQMDKIERTHDALYDLLEYTRKLVKTEARALSRNSNLPKKICTMALTTVPEPEFVDSYKIGYYLNSVLSNIYGYYDVTGESTDFEEEVDWERFFRAVFGKNRVPDVASLILMENPNRIAKYNQHPLDVEGCWNSLTDFALTNLNRSTSDVRDHMIELYLKRLNAITGEFDLRIDLRDLDDLRFENLCRTVRRYKSKFDEVLNKARKLAAAKPSTSPT